MTVNIIEESQYPPVITPLDMEIFSYQDDFPGSIIGKIKASDQDPYDILGYELLPTFSGGHLPPYPHLFEIDRRDGTIVALQGLDVGVYSLNVSVSDGKFTSYESARVTVNLVTDDLLRDKAVIVRFAEISPEDFVLSYRKSFIKIMKTLFNVRSKDVQILGAQPTYGSSGRKTRSAGKSLAKKDKRNLSGQLNLDVLFAVRKSTAIYYSRDEVRSSLVAKLTSVAAQLGLKIIQVQRDECTKSACTNGVCRDLVVMSETQVISVTTWEIALSSRGVH